MKLISNLKGKLYYYLVEKNPDVKNAYQGYVTTNPDKHQSSRFSSWLVLLKCNIAYRILKVPAIKVHAKKISFFSTDGSDSRQEEAAKKWERIGLSLMLSIAESGGSIFDFFLDQGIPEIAVYGETPFATHIFECAFHANYPISHTISDEERSIAATSPDIHYIPFVRLDDVVSFDPQKPILIAAPDISAGVREKLERLSRRVYLLHDILDYAYEKNMLANQLLSLQAKYPHIPMVICNLPQVRFVKNRSELEEYVHQYTIPGECDTPEKWHQNVIDAVYRVHGFTDDYLVECLPAIATCQVNGIHYCSNRSGKYVNCVNGCRVTTGGNPSADGTIYMFGSSSMQGMGAHDEGTISSYLQAFLNERQPPDNKVYNVLNCANTAGKHFRIILDRINSCRFEPNDIILVGTLSTPFVFDALYSSNFITCNAQPLFDRPRTMGEVFYESGHMNFIGYQAVAQAIFQTMQSHNLLSEEPYQFPVLNQPAREFKPSMSPTIPTLPLNASQGQELMEYLKQLEKQKPAGGKIGAIVVNCNPFTNGHRYLIETALKQVDHLFVFVVEEDKSAFPFSDRLRLVQEGTADLKSLTVLPSGRFIISSLTFNMYFRKESLQEHEIDPSADVMLFGQYIAPALGISVRFVGDEPFDRVTAQYNTSMDKILPALGVAVQIIPRLQTGGQAVSASQVRKLLKEKRWEEIRQLVPTTTYQYLIEKWEQPK